MIDILVLPGDGIGPEVTAVAVEVLRHVGAIHELPLRFETADIGGAAIDRYGQPLPPAVLKKARKADALLLGAVGGPKWDALPHRQRRRHRQRQRHRQRPEQALLGLRRGLGLFANLRPARIFSALVGSSSLKPEIVKGVDLLVVRELTGGIYFGKPRGIRGKGTRDKVGFNTEIYSTREIERIGRVAFDLARGRRKSVISVDKANILESSILWREVIGRVGKNYPDVALEHMYVDNCAMQLVRNPRRFDVIVTNNLFGDILSDEAAMLTGSIGMLPSASLGGRKNSVGLRRGLYEPVHGSAPDIAGKGLANPLAAVLSSALLLRYSLGRNDLALRVERAVEAVLNEGYRTPDLAAGDGSRTDEVAKAILDRL